MKQFNSYLNSRHGKKANTRAPAAKQECETCHGPGENHVENSPKKGEHTTTIRTFGRFSPLKAREQNSTCLTCHSRGKTVLWQGSTHSRKGLTCTNCHSIHGGNRKFLVKRTVTEVCTQCHKNIKAQIQMSSHHPIREGKVTCVDCHNPHGTVANRLISANSIQEKCYQCHMEKRGPFLYQHPPVVEDCLNCHRPHGSNHDKLLVRRRPYLCQSCHSDSGHPDTLWALGTGQAGYNVYNAPNTIGTGAATKQIGSTGSRLINRSCSNCHSQIHGSNHPSGKVFFR